MRNYEQELENRVAFIRQLLKESGCEGIVYGNSGGKDSALVGIITNRTRKTRVALRQFAEGKRSARASFTATAAARTARSSAFCKKARQMP